MLSESRSACKLEDHSLTPPRCANIANIYDFNELWNGPNVVGNPDKARHSWPFTGPYACANAPG